jgi:hypothetical protein
MEHEINQGKGELWSNLNLNWDEILLGW